MTVPVSVLDAIRRAESLIITSHIVPDGDAIGSILGMGLSLMSAGKRVYMIVDNGVPVNLSFLNGSSLILRDPSEVPGGLDLAIILDVGSYDRIGAAEAPAKSAKAQVNIDHHATNSGFTDLLWIDTSAPATGVMVAELVRALGIPFEAHAASALYCAISTDTGSFRYSNTNSDCFRLAAELIDAGADPYAVSMNVYDSKPFGAVKGLGEVLSEISIESGGRLAVMEITRSLMLSYSLSEGDVEGFISYGRSIEGVEVCVAFKEIEVGLIKVGFRSKALVDVSSIAASFGGGGHKRASGCTVKGTLAEVRGKVVAAVNAALCEVFSHECGNRD